MDEVAEKGEILKKRMLELKEKVSIIGDVRGKGLMLGCEFVDPKGTPDALGSLPASGDIAARVQQMCFQNKLVMEKAAVTALSCAVCAL